MVEAGAKEVSEEDMLEALMFGHEAVKELCLFQEEIINEIGEEKIENKIVPEMETEKDEISDELYGAKKYFQKYMDSGDSVFKEMAKDELKHAEILIKKANAKLPSGEEKARLKEYELELKEISEKVNE